MMLELFKFISSNLIGVMFILLIVALGFRYLIYAAGKRDHQYFKSFSDTVTKTLENENKNGKIMNVEQWLKGFLDIVIAKLPERNVRNWQGKSSDQSKRGDFRSQKRYSFEEFSDGKRSIAHGILQYADAFVSSYPPKFSDLTTRILSQDKKWTTILGVIPLDKLSRFLDILPGMFIVFGIFGTFLGITAALPRIALIDLNQLDQAGPILNSFVADVSFSMHTSITGIICSVFLTFLNALFPVQQVRNEVRKNMSHCFESLWYRIHGGKVSDGEQQMIRLLQDISEGLRINDNETNDRKAS